METLGNLTYDYDAVGRVTRLGGTFARTGLPQPASTTSYNSANQQTAFGSQTLTYDNNGNLTSDGINSYGWNARNQLVSISGPSIAATFQYDAFGRRIGKTINSMTTGFLYDGANIVQEQATAGNTNIVAGGIDEVLTRTDASGTKSAVADGLGSVVGLTDAAGAIQTQYTYEPFGRTAASGASIGGSQQYTGRENDGTGLYYYRARYYSPSLQRLISEDPIGFKGGDINLYGYVQNSPVNFRDPYGRDLFGLVGGGFGGAAVGGLGAMGTGSYMMGMNTSGRKPKIGGAGSVGFGAGPDYSYPKSKEPSGGLGAAAGAGAGAFWSNAGSFQDLAGPFNTTIITGWGFSVEIDNAGPIYIVSITYGKNGFGGGIFHLKTNTPKWTTWERCAPRPMLPLLPPWMR